MDLSKTNTQQILHWNRVLLRQQALMKRGMARVLVWMMVVQLFSVMPVKAQASQPTVSSYQTPPLVLPELPLTESGRKYHACLVHLVGMVQSNNASATQGGASIGDLYGPRALQLAQHVVSQAPNTFADDFCESVHAPAMHESLRMLLGGAATATARRGAGRVGPQSSRPQVAVGVQGASGSLPVQASTGGNAVHAAGGFTFQTNKISNLTIPHEAEYFDGHDGYSDDDLNLAALISCTAIEIGHLVTGTVCALSGTAGTWEGIGGGAWQAPAKIVCLAVLTALEAGYTGCKDYLEFMDFFDSTVRAAQLKATYENVRKALDNQELLWKKVHYTDVLLSQTLARFEADMQAGFQVLAAQNCDLKTRLGDLQREANYLRYLLLTPVDKRPAFKDSAMTDCRYEEPSYNDCTKLPKAQVEALKYTQGLLKTEATDSCGVSDDALTYYDLTTYG